MIEDVAAAVVSAKQTIELRTFKSIRLQDNLEFSNLLKIKYNNNDEFINRNEEQEFDRIVFLGLRELKKEETGYEIIHKGKTADKRVLKKLGRIADELIKINTFPKIDGASLQVVLNKALGDMDRRPLKDYRETVLYYCNIPEEIISRCRDSRLGELDVSGFVKRVPSSFVKGDES